MADRKRNDSLQAQAGRYLGIGMTWALSTALFLYVGTRVDKWLGTGSLFTVVGAFVGAAAGFWYMYRHLMESVSKPESKRDGSDA